MEEGKRFIEDWLGGGAGNVAALCRLYSISRKTGYKWLGRFRGEGLPGLEERSQAAHEQPRRIPESIEERLIAARRRHPSWGPKKLRAWLTSREPETAWPAASTIGEALKRAGLVRGRKRLRRLAEAALSPLREPAASNELWTIDYKGQFRTGDGAQCYPLTGSMDTAAICSTARRIARRRRPKRGAAWSGCLASAGCRDGCARTTDRPSPRRARDG